MTPEQEARLRASLPAWCRDMPIEGVVRAAGGSQDARGGNFRQPGDLGWDYTFGQRLSVACPRDFTWQQFARLLIVKSRIESERSAA